MCGGPGNTKDSGSPVASDGEDSETESQYGVYRPLRNNKRDTGDIPLHEFTTDHPRDHACLYNHHRGSHGSRGSRGSATSADGAVGGIHPSNHHAHRCHFFAALQHHPHGHRVRYVCTLSASSQRAFPFFHGKSSLFFIFREKIRNGIGISKRGVWLKSLQLHFDCIIGGCYGTAPRHTNSW